ncbi:MAG: formate/nitrite transporter family protein [Spirochaetaceae bacterium]|jgi:formate/nitrite transporter|nr:formate/nitrite transporter family protein [Spirochaetaceae bacterium]
MLSPGEIIGAYAVLGKTKVERSTGKLFVLSFLAGFLIALGAAVCNTAAYSIDNVSLARIINAALFPFGLAMIMLLGAELFTGNCLIIISVLDKKTTIGGMLRNWILVYAGNFTGALFLTAGCVFFGQLNYSAGELAVFTIKTAAAKCALPFGNAFVFGFLCNVMVCLGVLCSLSAQDTMGKIAGAWIPVSFFVLCGFEHSIANMYYIPAGLLALNIPEYAVMAQRAGVDVSALTWDRFFPGNLLPVTAGNILGGIALGWALWTVYGAGKKAQAAL